MRIATILLIVFSPSSRHMAGCMAPVHRCPAAVRTGAPMYPLTARGATRRHVPGQRCAALVHRPALRASLLPIQRKNAIALRESPSPFSGSPAAARTMCVQDGMVWQCCVCCVHTEATGRSTEGPTRPKTVACSISSEQQSSSGGTCWGTCGAPRRAPMCPPYRHAVPRGCTHRGTDVRRQWQRQRQRQRQVA